MDTQERESSRQDVKVEDICSGCRGTGKIGLDKKLVCPNCKGAGVVPQYSLLERRLADLIYAKIPAGAMCPKCECELLADECVDDPDYHRSRVEWVDLAQAVVEIVKEAIKNETESR